MLLKILVDEDLPKSLSNFLRGKGFDVWDVRDAGLRGASDEQVLEFAVSKKALIVTGDIGFGSVKGFTGHHYGIFINRIPRELPVNKQIQIIWSCLEKLLGQDLRNKIIVCEPGRVRIREVV